MPNSQPYKIFFLQQRRPRRTPRPAMILVWGIMRRAATKWSHSSSNSKEGGNWVTRVRQSASRRRGFYSRLSALSGSNTWRNKPRGDVACQPVTKENATLMQSAESAALGNRLKDHFCNRKQRSVTYEDMFGPQVGDVACQPVTKEDATLMHSAEFAALGNTSKGGAVSKCNMRRQTRMWGCRGRDGGV